MKWNRLESNGMEQKVQNKKDIQNNRIVEYLFEYLSSLLCKKKSWRQKINPSMKSVCESNVFC